jgi:hypothetical protein
MSPSPFRCFIDGKPDVLITISMFDSADEAFASNERAANWVRKNVLEFTKGMPEVMIGHALIAEVRSQAPQDRPATGDDDDDVVVESRIAEPM